MNNLADKFNLFSFLWNIGEQIMIPFNIFIILIYSKNVLHLIFWILGTHHFLCVLPGYDWSQKSHGVYIVALINTWMLYIIWVCINLCLIWLLLQSSFSVKNPEQKDIVLCHIQ